MLTDALTEDDAAIFAAGSQHAADFSDRHVVRWHVENYWRFFIRNIVELTALRHAALINTEFGAKLEALTAANVDHLRDHLEPIIKAGRTLPGAPELVLPMFAEVLDAFRYRWEHSDGRFDGRRFDENEAIDTLTEFLYRALNG
jgi:hypothetical protein